MTHPYKDIHCIGEKCAMCGAEETRHKITEHEPMLSYRHPFTAYVCCKCFGIVFGGLAIQFCNKYFKELAEELDHGV